MADRNRNILRESSSSVKPPLINHQNRVAPSANSQDVTSPTTKKEGIYAKKDNSNYQRFVEYSKKDQNGKAPLVGWKNGSPTLYPSSPEDLVITPRAAPETPSESSGIGKDDEDTENLSSIADERGVPSTPGLTIDKSLESFSQDVELSSTPDLEENQLDFEPPEDAVPPNESCNDLPSPMDKPEQEVERQITGSGKEPVREDSQDRTQGILVRRQYSEAKSNSLFSSMDKDKKDSIDSSDAMLEIYDDDDDEDSENSNTDSKDKPKIPDGGWGWVVVVSSLVISMIADGVSFSFGLLYIEFLFEFEESKSTTAWIGSLFMAVPLLSGPIMSALVDRYGCRKMTIAGGIISGTGFVLSSRVDSIGVMYLTFGVLAGLGLGLCYVTAVVSIAFWFDKKRTLAVGLGACGTGIGTFVYAPMTTYFIEEYGWRGCVLLLAGTFFNMIVCGTVMRDPEWWILEQKKQQGQLSPKKSKIRGEIEAARAGDASPPGDEDFPGVEELRKMMKSGQAPEYLLQSLRTSTEARIMVGSGGAGGGNPAAFRSVVNLPTFVRQSEKVCVT